MSYKKPTKAIITDAGFASRYLPITKTIPKAMLPIGNKPIMQYVVEECAEAGIEEIIIVATREGKPIYEDYFNNSVNRIRKQLASQGKEDRYAPIQKVLDFPKIVVIEQDPSYPYGNGSPIASARPFIRDDEAFVVLYSDDVVFGSSDVKTLIDSYEQHPDAKAIIISQEMPTEVLDKYGIIRLFATVFDFNPASMRVLEKAGFTKEGILKSSAFKDGKVIDEHLYAHILNTSNIKVYL